MMKVLLSSICFIALFLISLTSAFSDVIVQDMIAPAGGKVMLKAETKGKLLSKGGKIVEFFVNGKSIGTSLSGGDGIAYRQFTPLKTGIYKIRARSDKEEGSGLLLSLKRGSKIIFVDVEGSLIEGLFSMKPRKGGKEAIKRINRKFPVILLQTGFMSTKLIKEWLKKYEFPELPVIPWREGSVFNEIEEEGFKIKALIGGPEVIDSAREYKLLAFSFQEAEDVIEVKDWEEIVKKLGL
ncbi:MAG: hypothetical protein AB1638_05725 [Nitrospirota bacterium]